MSRRNKTRSKPSTAHRAGAGPDSRGIPHADRAVPQVIGNRAVLRLLGSERVQTKALEEPAPADVHEQEADHAAEAVTGQAPAGPETAPSVAGPTLLVEDETAPSGPGQMRKSEFLDQLRASVCATAEEGLAAAGQTAQGCPWIEYWLGYYGGKDAARVEAAIRKFAPETAGAATAGEYIPLIAARVRQGVDQYAKTGEPPTMPDEMPGAGTAVGSPLLKARDGGVRPAQSPEAIRGRLGIGQPLDGGVRSSMETAFGADFSHVRLHVGSQAEALSSELNARAFTVGEHVAFGSGEYRPGTLVGDALIAHELAHVLQQDRAVSVPRGATAAHEADADLSAHAALSSSLSPSRRGAASPARMRAGLSLQRCTPKSSGSSGWSAEGVAKIIYSQGDQATLEDFLKKGNKIYRFTSAYTSWRYPDGKVVEEKTGLDGNTGEDPVTKVKIIRLRTDLANEEAAATLFHELGHYSRGDTTTNKEYLDQEIAVRIDEEKFRIKHGMPEGEPGYRKADGTVDEDAIRLNIETSTHYNPTTRKWAGRRYEGDKEETGWKAP
jgi:hypothetical protein